MGQCTNPLIRFDPIRGLAVGLVRRYPLVQIDSPEAAFSNPKNGGLGFSGLLLNSG